MNSGSGLGSMECPNDAMSTSAEVKEISTDSSEGAARKSSKEIEDLEATVSALRKVCQSYSLGTTYLSRHRKWSKSRNGNDKSRRAPRFTRQK